MIDEVPSRGGLSERKCAFGYFLHYALWQQLTRYSVAQAGVATSLTLWQGHWVVVADTTLDIGETLPSVSTASTAK